MSMSEAFSESRLKDEDEEMEEGEISSLGEEEDETHSSVNRGGRGSLEITVENKERGQLPDLLKEIGTSGVDVLDRRATERMEARAKRFNLKPEESANYEDIEDLYRSLGVETEEANKERKDRRYRLETIHVLIQGSSHNVQSSEIFEFFKEFNPISFEWVSNTSINVIWALPASASKAMLNLSRPIREREDAMEINVRSGDDNLYSGADLSAVKTKFEQSFDTPVYPEEIGGNISVPSGNWRFGKPSNLGTHVFMRFAKNSDTSQPELSYRNQQLRQEGIISSSLKRKLREVMIHEQEELKEEERRKKYAGPVGKNPWGSIAESWSTNSGKRIMPCPRDVFLPTRVRDWDAPYAEENKRYNIGHRGSHDGRRHKRNFDEDEGESESKERGTSSSRKRKRDLDDTDEEREVVTYASKDISSDDEEWNSKLKKPRMTMIADQMEKKLPAKSRLYKGLKRRFKNLNSKNIKIYEEEEESESSVEDSSPERKDDSSRAKLTLSVDVADLNRFNRDEACASPSKKTLTDRFQNRHLSSRIGASLRSRLGEKKIDSDEEEVEKVPESHSATNMVQFNQGQDIMDVDNKNEEKKRSSKEPTAVCDQSEIASTIAKIKKENNKIKKLPQIKQEKKDPESSPRKSMGQKNLAEEKHQRSELLEVKKRLGERPTLKAQPQSLSRSRRRRRSRKRESSSSDSSDSSDSSSSSSSGSSSDSDSSGSNSSASSSSTSGSSSSTSSSSDSEEDNRKRKSRPRSRFERRTLKTRREEELRKKKKSLPKSGGQNKKSSSRKDDRYSRNDSSKKESSKSSGGLRDKLKEYLKQAKERKKKTK